jgi:hypothetical protein
MFRKANVFHFLKIISFSNNYFKIYIYFQNITKINITNINKNNTIE